jgi:indole-3-acetate monooxygenase
MLPEIHHPSDVIKSEITNRIRHAARHAEILKQLHPRQLELIYSEQWLRMFVPKENGGMGLSLPEVLKIEECLSWADGSTGWVITLCSGAGWFIGFIDPEITKVIFSSPHVCIAGSGASTGVAEFTGEHYNINGVWKYASGILHATHITANCYIHKEGRMTYHADGSPVIGSFIMDKDHVKIHETWNSMGMIATASHTFEVSNLKVHSNRRFNISSDHARLTDPIYQYPFLQLAETTLAVNISGMAIRFLECAEQQLKEKNHNVQIITDTQFRLNQCRQQFFNSVNDSWQTLIFSNQIPDELQSRVSSVSHQLVNTSMSSVNSIYPLCGLRAANTELEINRIWRNIHTAGQHSLFTDKKLKNDKCSN